MKAETELTLDEIRRKGLEALRNCLGRAGMIRFLQQFESGAGDYTKERREWVESTSLDDIFEQAKRLRRTGKKGRA